MSPALRAAVLVSLLACSCEGVASLSGEGPGGTPVDPRACDVSAFSTVQLDTIVQEFSQKVQPRLASNDRGCSSCHSPTSGRPFVVMLSGADTFSKAFQGGFFKDDPRSLLSRLAASNGASQMPPVAAWDAADIDEVARIACMARAWEAAGTVPVDEQFPPNLLQPYVGAPNTDYDNTFIKFPQLKNKVTQVFGDAWVRDGGSQWDANIALFGGVDFVSHLNEARSATPDFLLGLDALAPDVCGAAAANRTGPFAGLDVSTSVVDAADGGVNQTRARATISTVTERLLFRPATTAEQTSTYALLKDLSGLGTTAQAWSGVCEALLRHPDFLFLLPPSFATTTDPALKDRLRVVALAQHLVGRPPTSAEFTTLSTQGFSAVLDALLASPDFETWYFGRMRLRTESVGSAESDEPARLWTYLAVNGKPYDELLTADYSVDSTFKAQPRPTQHGRTGVLTMKGYLNNKPGLPHYNYPARVLSGFMGTIFEVPPEVFDMRAGATASSTVDPSSVCFSCHQLLTPLAHQRLRWDDDGNYRTTMPDGTAVNDTDRGLVPSYPYPGQGLEAFTTRAVKKEAFKRRMLNAQFTLLMGRDLRYEQDERALYKSLWDVSEASRGDLRAVLKSIALSQPFQRVP